MKCRYLTGLLVAAIAGIVATAGPALGAAHAKAQDKAQPSAHDNAQHSAQPSAQSPAVSHVVIVGIPGLRWSDVSAATSPALYGIAAQGSVGTLVEHAVLPHTCPADGWLTLNVGVRAQLDHTESAPCPALPPVDPRTGTVASMPSIVAYNNTLGYGPAWGTLAKASAQTSAQACQLAVGPGAALALANAQGQVSSYLPGPASLTEAALARCPLTVVGLGALPASPAGTRAAAVRAADASIARIAAELPSGTILMVTSPGALDKAQLGVVVVDGPGYRDGLLDASSTRQPGLSVITDLTPTVLHWLGRAAPAGAGLTGAQLTRAGRSTLSTTIKDFTGRETAEQIWTTSHSWFFWIYALADVAVLGVIGLALWGAADDRRRRRARGWRTAGVFAAAVPLGTFLANLVPWPRLPHPAIWLYAVSVAAGLVIGLAALLGSALLRPRDPLAPFGIVCLATTVVLGIDVMTGSRLQLETPFGLSLLEAGRFYGIGNEALGIYGMAALAGAAWLGLRLLERYPGRRRPALIAVAAIAVFTVFASGWPGFGGKAGGTITIVPCFLLLLLVLGGLRVTWRRVLLIAVSGLLLLAVFALISYFVPATGSSDIGSFAGNVIHGRAAGGDLLERKIRSNIGSLSVNAFSPLIPIVLAISALMLWRPSWFGLKTVPLAYAAEPLLPMIIGVLWLLALLGWFANDSGIIVPATAMPFALPLGIAMLAAAAYQDRKARYVGTAPSASVAGQPV